MNRAPALSLPNGPTLLAVCVLLVSCAAIAVADAQLHLEQARAAVGRGDRDAAIAHLEQAVAQDDKLAAAHRWLSRLYADKGMDDRALDAAAAAVLLEPDAADQEYLRRLLAGGLPKTMGRRTPDALPLRKVMIALEPGGDRLSGRPGARQALIILGEDRAAAASDPRFGWAFDRACCGYALDDESPLDPFDRASRGRSPDRPAGGGRAGMEPGPYGACGEPGSQRWRLTLVVHYAASGGPGRAELAADCAGLLARIACLREAYLGPQPAHRPQMAPAAPGPLQVWLADAGEPGAESWGSNIYLYAVATPRAPAEWVRQVIHEYGHVALPGVNHFTEPERWANGRLSEQLFARWLGDRREGAAPSPAAVGAGLPTGPRAGTEPRPYLTAADLSALAADGDRCLSVFLQQGPSSPLIADATMAGMDYYLGFAAYVERAFGPRVLASAMRLAPGRPNTRAFVVGVQEALCREVGEVGAQHAAPLLELRAVPQGTQAHGAQWVYLPAGRWMAACRGVATAIVFNGRTVRSSRTDIGRMAAGWHRVTAPPGTTVTFAPAGR